MRAAIVPSEARASHFAERPRPEFTVPSKWLRSSPAGSASQPAGCQYSFA